MTPIIHRFFIPLAAFLFFLNAGGPNSAYARGDNTVNQPLHRQTTFHFMENKGQVTDQYGNSRKDIDFKLNTGNGLSIFIGSGAIHYQWVASLGNGKQEIENENSGLPDPTSLNPKPAEMYRMDVELVGANPHVQILKEDQQGFYERYYLSTLPNGTIAHAFRKIIYKDIYPNIDWMFYFNEEGQLEHDFIVRPGGKINDIKIKYGGATSISLNMDGSLTAETPLGTVTEKAPYCIQQNGKVIASKFVLDKNLLSFNISAYAGTLIIDPVLEWGTYFGGTEADNVNQIAADNVNNYYITGYTLSSINIATTGAYQSVFLGAASLSNEGDVFIAKFNNSGDRLWATYYGGEEAERANGVACDNMGNVYIIGSTESSTGIATPGSYQDTLGAIYNYNSFLAKFDSTGTREWSSYYGGISSYGQAITCIPSGGIAITGYLGASGSVAFLANFDKNGNKNWDTTIAGTGVTKGMGIAYGGGYIYITGNTTSPGSIATPNAFQGAVGGASDAFLAKFDTATGTMHWSTYFGGPGSDYGTAVHIASNGTVYLNGTTTSTTGIASPGAHQDSIGTISGPSSDVFLGAFDTSGGRLWSTYYGGATYDNSAKSIASDPLGNVYITGATNSSVGISTPGSYQTNWSGAGFDVFIAKFNSSGQRQWGTYYGGSSPDYGQAIASDQVGNIYIAGYTTSASGIATTGSFQSSINGAATDAFIVKFNDCDLPAAPDTIMGALTVCSDRSYVYSIDPVPGALSYIWTLPSDWLGSSDSSSILLTPNSGSGSIYVAAHNYCATGDSIALNITLLPTPEPVIMQNDNILSTTTSFATYQWIRDGQDIPGATNSTYITSESGDYSVRVTNTEGCSAVSEEVSYEGANSITEPGLAQNGITIYPNPTHSYFFIKSIHAVKFMISGVDGRVLQAGVVPKGTTKISMQKYAEGIYFVHIYAEDGNLIGVPKMIIKD